MSDESNDDSDNEHKKKNQHVANKSYLLIHPDSTVRAIWDLSLFAAIVYQSITLPMRISFEMVTDTFTFYLETMIDSLFILDVMINFNTGFYEANTLITSRFEIAKDYLKFWFWIDLVSSIPYTWIFAWSQGISLRMIESDSALEELGLSANMTNAPQLLKLLKIAKLMKMLKLLRVMKLKKIMNKFDEYIVTDSMDLMVTFINLTIYVLVIAHYMSCIFYYVGIEELRTS